MSDTAIKMEWPTTAERLSRQAFYAAVTFHRDVEDLRNRYAVEDFRTGVVTLQEILESQILNLFRSIEPALQEENRLLRDQLMELHNVTVKPIAFFKWHGGEIK